MNNSIVEKIKKALNLANNNPNQEEAESAMLMAQKLMAKHNIEMNEINFEEKKKEVNHDLATDYVSKMPWWYIPLGSIISDNFKCTLYQNKGNRKAALGFIGFKEDIEIASIILNYAIQVIEYNVKKYIKQKQREGWLTRGLRDDFIKGFLAGLREKFIEQIEKENWGLILVKDEAIIEYTNKNFESGKSQSSFGNGRGDDEAFSAGFQKGKEFERPNGQLEG